MPTKERERKARKRLKEIQALSFKDSIYWNTPLSAKRHCIKSDKFTKNRDSENALDEIHNKNINKKECLQSRESTAIATPLSPCSSKAQETLTSKPHQETQPKPVVPTSERTDIQTSQLINNSSSSSSFSSSSSSSSSESEDESESNEKIERKEKLLKKQRRVAKELETSSTFLIGTENDNRILANHRANEKRKCIFEEINRLRRLCAENKKPDDTTPQQQKNSTTTTLHTNNQLLNSENDAKEESQLNLDSSLFYDADYSTVVEQRSRSRQSEFDDFIVNDIVLPKGQQKRRKAKQKEHNAYKRKLSPTLDTTTEDYLDNKPIPPLTLLEPQAEKMQEIEEDTERMSRKSLSSRLSTRREETKQNTADGPTRATMSSVSEKDSKYKTDRETIDSKKFPVAVIDVHALNHTNLPEPRRKENDYTALIAMTQDALTEELQLVDVCAPAETGTYAIKNKLFEPALRDQISFLHLLVLKIRMTDATTGNTEETEWAKEKIRVVIEAFHRLYRYSCTTFLELTDTKAFIVADTISELILMFFVAVTPLRERWELPMYFYTVHALSAMQMRFDDKSYCLDFCSVIGKDILSLAHRSSTSATSDIFLMGATAQLMVEMDKFILTKSFSGMLNEQLEEWFIDKPTVMTLIHSIALLDYLDSLDAIYASVLPHRVRRLITAALSSQNFVRSSSLSSAEETICRRFKGAFGCTLGCDRSVSGCACSCSSDAIQVAYIKALEHSTDTGANPFKALESLPQPNISQQLSSFHRDIWSLFDLVVEQTKQALAASRLQYAPRYIADYLIALLTKAVTYSKRYGFHQNIVKRLCGLISYLPSCDEYDPSEDFYDTLRRLVVSQMRTTRQQELQSIWDDVYNLITVRCSTLSREVENSPLLRDLFSIPYAMIKKVLTKLYTLSFFEQLPLTSNTKLTINALQEHVTTFITFICQLFQKSSNIQVKMGVTQLLLKVLVLFAKKDRNSHGQVKAWTLKKGGPLKQFLEQIYDHSLCCNLMSFTETEEMKQEYTTKEQQTEKTTNSKTDTKNIADAKNMPAFIVLMIESVLDKLSEQLGYYILSSRKDKKTSNEDKEIKKEDKENESIECEGIILFVIEKLNLFLSQARLLYQGTNTLLEIFGRVIKMCSGKLAILFTAISDNGKDKFVRFYLQLITVVFELLKTGTRKDGLLEIIGILNTSWNPIVKFFAFISIKGKMFYDFKLIAQFCAALFTLCSLAKYHTKAKQLATSVNRFLSSSENDNQRVIRLYYYHYASSTISTFLDFDDNLAASYRSILFILLQAMPLNIGEYQPVSFTSISSACPTGTTSMLQPPTTMQEVIRGLFIEMCHTDYICANEQLMTRAINSPLLLFRSGKMAVKTFFELLKVISTTFKSTLSGGQLQNVELKKYVFSFSFDLFIFCSQQKDLTTYHRDSIALIQRLFSSFFLFKQESLTASGLSTPMHTFLLDFNTKQQKSMSTFFRTLSFYPCSFLESNSDLIFIYTFVFLEYLTEDPETLLLLVNTREQTTPQALWLTLTKLCISSPPKNDYCDLPTLRRLLSLIEKWISYNEREKFTLKLTDDSDAPQDIKSTEGSQLNDTITDLISILQHGIDNEALPHQFSAYCYHLFSRLTRYILQSKTRKEKYQNELSLAIICHVRKLFVDNKRVNTPLNSDKEKEIPQKIVQAYSSYALKCEKRLRENKLEAKSSLYIEESQSKALFQLLRVAYFHLFTTNQREELHNILELLFHIEKYPFSITETFNEAAQFIKEINKDLFIEIIKHWSRLPFK